MSNLIIKDLEYGFPGDVIGLSKEDQSMTIGGNKWIALGHAVLYILEFLL